MSKPRIIASGPMGARELDDSVYSELGYQGLDGLFEPAMVAKGATIATFDGPVRVRPQSTYYEPRTFSLYGYLIGGSGQAEMEQTSESFFQAISGSNTRFHVGSLFLDCNVTAKPRYDRFKDFTTRRDYRLECEAIPALWGSEYHQSVGGSQGIYVRDDRLDHASIKMTDVTGNGREVQFTYAGSAPTRCALMISGVTSGTTYYIVNPHDGRAVSFTASSTVEYIPASRGPWLYPNNDGANVLRLQSDTSGTLVASGTYLWALVPSAFTTRFLGNSGDKFSEGPVFSFYRRGVGRYYSAAATVSTGVDMQARIGLPPYTYSGIEGAWTAAKAGLVLEQSATNTCLRSQEYDNATWAKGASGSITATNITDPEATATADRWNVTAADANAYIEQSISGQTENTVYTWSVWVKTDSGTKTFRMYRHNTITWASATVSATFTATTTWQRFSVSYTTGAGETTSMHGLGAESKTPFVPSTGNYDLWGGQVESGPLATSYIPTTTAAVTRNADYAGLYRPHDYLKYSRDLTQTSAWTVTGTGSAQPTRSGTVADGTASGNLWVIGNVDNKVAQAVTPDCRPNSTPWTVVAALRLPSSSALSGLIYLQLEDQGGTARGTPTTVSTSDLSTTETRTFFCTATAAQIPTATTGLQAAVKGNTNLGNVVVESIGLLKGSFPGAPAHTEGSAIPLPQYGYDWPDWCTQNGYVEFDAVLPPISTGLTAYVFGSSDGYLSLYRHTAWTTGQNLLKVTRRSEDGTTHENNVTVGAIWDGAVHTLKIEWVNYVSGGTQYMYLRLYVDGVLKTGDNDGNLASATVTEWSAPERLQPSNGNTIATVRDLTFGVA